MVTPKKRIVLTSITMVIILALFLFGGSAMTVMASQSALPGDTLYSVKTTVEQTRVSIARDAAARAQLQIGFAGNRLLEIEQLVAEGRFSNVPAATAEFETHIQNALMEVGLVSDTDPERAALLLSQITETLTRYAAALNRMLNTAPDAVRNEMLRALETLHAAGGLRDAPGFGNENANGNDNLNDNGSTNANLNDNLNSNGNENDQFIDNSNTNSNANTNTNTNDNTNSSPAPRPVNPQPVANQNDNDNESYTPPSSPGPRPPANTNDNDNSNPPPPGGGSNPPANTNDNTNDNAGPNQNQNENNNTSYNDNRNDNDD